MSVKPASETEETPSDIPGAGLPLKVALLTNIIPPYLLPTLRCLSKRLRRLQIFLSTAMEPDRTWEPSWKDLEVKIQKSVALKSRQKHPQGFTLEFSRHFPLDTLPLLARHRPDVVISTQLGFRTFQAVLYRLIFRRVRLVIWVDASEQTQKGAGRVLTAVRRTLLARADAVMAIGESGMRHVMELGVRRERIVQIPFVIDHAGFESVPLQREPPAELRLLYVGQLIERKGLVPFLQLLIAWARTHPDKAVEFWLLGGGPLQSRLSRMDAPENLTLKFLANSPYERLPEFYAQAGILVLPTLADTWALVVNEALASGLPVLGSVYSQAVEQLVREGENGWTFRPDDLSETADALNRALSTNRERLAQMRGVARNSVRHLTPELAVEGLLKVISLSLAKPLTSAGDSMRAMVREP